MSTPTANVIQQLVRTTDGDKFTDIVALLLEENESARAQSRPTPPLHHLC